MFFFVKTNYKFTMNYKFTFSSVVENNLNLYKQFYLRVRITKLKFFSKNVFSECIGPKRKMCSK